MEYEHTKRTPVQPKTMIWEGRDEHTGLTKRTRYNTDGSFGETVIWDDDGIIRSRETIRKNKNGIIMAHNISGHSQWNELYD